VFNARHQVSVGLLRAFADAGIDWAWPTQVTIVGDAEGRPTGLLPVHTAAQDEAEEEAASPPNPHPPSTPMPASDEIAPE